jgi:alkylated DNA repair dioxygenase AlkB
MVAILSLGETRRLMLRPEPGVPGSTRAFALGHGDLVVMGGSSQRTWQHAVPKSSTPCGPRISVQFRPRGVL